MRSPDWFDADVARRMRARDALYELLETRDNLVVTAVRDGVNPQEVANIIDLPLDAIRRIVERAE